jgi:hypothetical protein
VRTIYKPTESTALFAVNEAFARQDFSGCEALPLRKIQLKENIPLTGSLHGMVRFIGRLSLMFPQLCRSSYRTVGVALSCCSSQRTSHHKEGDPGKCCRIVQKVGHDRGDQTAPPEEIGHSPHHADEGGGYGNPEPREKTLVQITGVRKAERNLFIGKRRPSPRYVNSYQSPSMHYERAASALGG